MDNRAYFLWLSEVLGPGAVISELLSEYGTAEEIYCRRETIPADMRLFSAGAKARMKTFTLKEADERLQMVLSSGYSVMCPEDDCFPARLKAFDTCPAVLYYMGDTALLSETFFLAVVGARKPEIYYRNLTGRLCTALADAGTTLISGFATGIDTETHLSAAAAEKGSIAILPNGIDVVYPAENRPLRKEILRKGLILTEFAPGLPAYPEHFRIRNRLFPMLADAVLVAEANGASGSIMTGHLTLETSTELFVFPDRPGRGRTAGNLQLLGEGGLICTGPQDILLGFQHLFSGTPHEGKVQTLLETGAKLLNGTPDSRREERVQKNRLSINLSEEEKRILSALTERPQTVDELSRILGIPPGTLSAKLVGLDVAGMVAALPGNQYCKK